MGAPQLRNSSIKSVEEKHSEIDEAIAELRCVQKSVESMLDSAVFIANQLDRLYVKMEIARKKGKL